MKWPLMTAAEVHAFGIEAILPYVQKEGVAVESVNANPAQGPQIVGQRWGSLAFIMVKTACYPHKGQLTPGEFNHWLAWADRHGATAFFASVGITCVVYPDQSDVRDEQEQSLPIRHAGFNIAYEGLVVMTTSNRVTILAEE